MSPKAMLEQAALLQEARELLDRRMDLIHRADGLPNGFKILTTYQKRTEETNLASNPEQEKLWSEAVRAVEKEKKEKEAKNKRHFTGQRKGLLTAAKKKEARTRTCDIHHSSTKKSARLP